MRSKLFFLSLFLFFTNFLYSQSIDNVRFTQNDTLVYIYYDLHAEANTTFEVSLFCSLNSGETFDIPVKATQGDVGFRIKAGNNKKIIWNVFADLDKINSEQVIFEVKARGETSHFPMVWVASGSFWMGSSKNENSSPVHKVSIKGFYISKYEITQAEWQQIMGSNPAHFKNCPNCPIENVNWYDVQEFISQINIKTAKNYRLPTEAEWEYAAQGGNNTNRYADFFYAGSNRIKEVAWFANNAQLKTHAVDSKKPNQLGIYGMSGNVWEWCNDWFGAYHAHNQENPRGAITGSWRVVRGGSFQDYSNYCRVSTRYFYKPNFKSKDGGFRLVLTENNFLNKK